MAATAPIDNEEPQKAKEAATAKGHKGAQQAIAEIERDLRSIINTIPTSVWSALPDGYCDFLSQRWLDYTGMTAEQAQGWGWADAIHPEDRKGLVEYWQWCLASGTPVDTEARLRRYDAAYRWFLFRANPVRDASGNIVKWYGTNIDIEDRKTHEEALRTRELSWRQIVDNIPGQVATTGPMGEVEFLNRQTLEYFGKTTEELKNWSLIDVVHPEDLPHVIEARKKSIEAGQIYEVEHRCLRADGVYRWFQVRGAPVRDMENRITAWYLLLTDIDDRKKAEEALRSSEHNLTLLTNVIPTFIAELNIDGLITYVNQAVLDYTGLTLQDVQKGEFRSRVFHPDDVEKLLNERRDALTRPVPFENEQRVLGQDGRYRWFLIRYNPSFDEEGRIERWYVAATDIEDRKKAEEALQSNERNLDVMINLIPALIHTGRPDGYLDYFNRRWLEYLGCSLVDVEGWNWTSWIHPDDLNGIVDKWKACLASGEIFEYETRVRRRNGEYRYMFHRKVPLRDEHGNILRWYGTSFDIEDRKRAEEQVRRSEADLRKAFDEIKHSEAKLMQVIDAIPTMAWCMLPDGSNEFLNRNWHEYTGLSAEQSHGWGWQVAFHPEDLPPLMEKWRGMLVSGEPGEIEARLRRYDGAYRWFLIRAQPFNEAGKIVRWYGTSTDIEDRKRAEAQVEQAYLRLAEAQRLSKTGSFITDLVADDHKWSEEAFRIFEFDPETRVTVPMIRNRVHPEDLPSFDAVVARGMTGADVDFVFRIVTSRGAVKHIHGMARVIQQIPGRPLFIGALHDVTESKLAEEELDRARSQLAHVARVTTLNALTASIAHEVNQPLSGIITNASTCRRMLDSDPPNIDGARETARRIVRDGNRASDVISRLRTLFSKGEFTLEPLDLNEATQEVIALSLSDLQRNRVILRLQLADDLPSVTGDRIQLQQVILNLLRNASDSMATVEDRPRELGIRTEKDGGDKVCLSVRDAGVGFRPEAADKLFEAFYTTKSDGMGIGLSVSRSIVEAHHGRLWAVSNDGPGATFLFSIPCRPESITGAAPQ